MATQLLQTKHGQSLMATAMAATDAFLFYNNSLMDLITATPRERWPHQVVYSVGIRSGYFAYVPPDEFRVTPARPGPSDCVWIVPGTTP